MANSRKDTKGYVLRTGECQRSDGRYSYSYTDQGFCSVKARNKYRTKQELHLRGQSICL